MSKIYDKAGNKMNVGGIVAEILEIATDEQKKMLADSMAKYGEMNSHAKVAHGILDVYKNIDGNTDQGARLRKLLDNIMTKYQKSSNTTADDQSQYHYLFCELSK